MKKIRRAFTLVEMLVAVTVLVLIMALCSQMVFISSLTWKRGKARADAFTKARGMLGLIERDIQAAVLRPDLAAFADEDGRPACAFYTRLAGVPDATVSGTGPRDLSLVKYTVSVVTQHLQRYELAYKFGGTLTLMLSGTALPDLTEARPQNVSGGVLDFQIEFLDGTGKLQDSYVFDYNNPLADNNTRVAVLSLLMLDNDGAKIAGATNSVARLAVAFSGAPLAAQTHAQYWNDIVSDPSFGQDLPAPVRSAVHVFERRVVIPAATVSGASPSSFGPSDAGLIQ
ncbi:MAG: prepilin-type N-terminal cleavage/methylation domain-containing protein [Verrucomicrobiales bacterium]|nr:prepilin-type N-terminal cleavage/methylation domain-containing protein [Verrucomicrobiales bacterium]